MTLFEIADEALVAFRTVRAGADLYEREIETLLWSNLEEFTGEPLFPVARQPKIGTGGRPDIVALDEAARVVVIEVKRDVDRGQLAQCLEYAGWARTTSLDELATLYHGGTAEDFFTAWQDFTESTTPVVVNPAPRLMLVARDFDARTRSALDFLQGYDLPITVIPVSMYEDAQGRRFVEVGSDYEPPPVLTSQGAPSRTTPTHVLYRGRRVTISDLLDHGLLVAGDELVWQRPRLGEVHTARVVENGTIELHDGGQFTSPSQAAQQAAQIPAYDGWHAWKVTRLDGTPIDDLRRQLIDLDSPEPGGTA